MAKSDIIILYENDQIVAINKPHGISVTPDRGGATNVVAKLTKQLTLTEPLRLIHRLDKDTSGLLLIAKNKEAQSRFSRYFAKREINKVYLALVKGPIFREKGAIKDPIARSKRNPQAMHIHPRLGKPAQTNWIRLADFGKLTLIAAQPVTGRTHQIRIHFAHRHMPLAIDPVYGSTQPIMLSDFKANYRPARWEDERPLIDRLTLHAYQLTFPGVLEESTDMSLESIDQCEEKTTIVAGCDKKFAAMIKMLNKHTTTGEGFYDPELLEKIINCQPLELDFSKPVDSKQQDEEDSIESDGNYQDIEDDIDENIDEEIE